MSRSDLVDPAFARELEALRRKLQVRARSGGGGDHLGRRRGGSAEFLEHRPYAPGDDLRRIDWLAFARTGEPVFKLFRAEEDIVVRLVMDTSQSLDYGSPTKMLAAKRLAASVGYMALAQSERAQVVASSAGDFRMTEPTRGRASLPALLRDLDALAPHGGTDLARAIDSAVARSPRPGLMVVLSDFLDPGPFDVALTRAASAGHDVALVQVLAQEELEPSFEGDLAFEDAETSERVEVTVDPRAIDAYLARLRGLFATVRAIAKRCRGVYVRTSNVEPAIQAVRRFVARGVD
ncbi:DUF58 domain-containing protein [Pendulispora albinea]|uniref:DUF58 domain-containing protein n=1 Tax=Pendulispora albinea TaxID=2741071 RepID=A0ABZ2M8G1_9BACT